MRNANRDVSIAKLRILPLFANQLEDGFGRCVIDELVGFGVAQDRADTQTEPLDL